MKGKPYSGLITNTKKIDFKLLGNYFKDFKNHPIVPNSLIFLNDIKLGNDPLFQAGCFYIQEPSAMLVVHLLDVKPDDKVIDLAAAPGGKSFQVATKLDENGLLIANDINYSRAKVLSSNVEKFGFKNVIVTSNSPFEFNKNHQGYFDKVILDAPCSGEGMFRKDESALKDWSVAKVNACAINQKQLILAGYKLLKKGGIMVYSTCTFNQEENEEIIKHLLNNTNAKLIKIIDHPLFNRGIGLDDAIRVYPFNFPGEGHFIALIESQDDHSCKPQIIKATKFNNFKLIDEFFINNTNYRFDPLNLVLLNAQVYLKPKTNFDYTNYHILRLGWNIGEIKNNLFFASHGLAMGSTSKDFKQNINFQLSDPLLSKYLKGETIDGYDDGYYLVNVENVSLGLAKVVGSKFKNYYPKGLRIK